MVASNLFNLNINVRYAEHIPSQLLNLLFSLVLKHVFHAFYLGSLG